MAEPQDTFSYRQSSPEIWSIVQGWPNYEVSNLGRVRRAMSATGYQNTTAPGRPLKPHIDKDGYEHVLLCGPNNSRKCLTVHRLVASAFVPGEMPGLVAAHLDGQPANNIWTNLCWVTQAENIAHKEIHGTTARGERCGLSKLTADQVRIIRRTYTGRRGQQAELARQFNVFPGTIRYVLFDGWRHVDAN